MWTSFCPSFIFDKYYHIRGNNGEPANQHQISMNLESSLYHKCYNARNQCLLLKLTTNQYFCPNSFFSGHRSRVNRAISMATVMQPIHPNIISEAT